MIRIKKILFFVLLIVVWLPLLQLFVGYFKSEPLKGAYTYHQEPTLTDSSWFNGDFQKEYEVYINDSIGFHNTLIRLRNQIDFSLFNKCHSYDIELGKDGYLVATTHFDAYLGRVKTRTTKLDSSISNMVFLNDTLTKLNKKLIVIFASSKGSYCLDKAPSWYDTSKVAESDYEYYKKKLANTLVKTIDFDEWFLSQKNKTKHMLYSKCGIHWSTYGAIVALDSTLRFMEKNSGNEYRDIVISNMEKSRVPRYVDADLNNTLNLFKNVSEAELTYPNFYYQNIPKSDRKVLFVGDSYFFTFQDIPNQIFNDYSFWYYNKTIFSNGPNNGKSVKDVNLLEEIKKHDEIVLIATQINLNDFGWGFLENTTRVFKEQGKLQYYIEKIKNDPSWYVQIVEKAPKNGFTVQQQLEADARYMISIEK